MSKTVSVTETTRRFLQPLRSVRNGNSDVVTSHGKPVARMIPIQAGANATAEARRQLVARLRSESASGAGSWTRTELYEY